MASIFIRANGLAAIVGIFVALAICIVPGASPAQESQAGESRAQQAGISIELNSAKPSEGACRFSLVFTNTLKMTVDALSVETVIFDKQGSVERFVVLKSRPLTPGKIRVQQFDMRGIECGSIGKLLLNDVVECKAGDLSIVDCLVSISVSSRTGVPFVSTAASN